MLSTTAFTQKVNDTPKTSKATSLKAYKMLYGDNFTKKDSLNFIIRENDTLVLLPKDYGTTEGITVHYEPKDSSFLEIYKDIVYKKYSLKNSAKKKEAYMRLWSKPIKIFFAKSLDKKYKAIITKLALGITKEVDSLDISFVSNLEESNYVVYQIDENHSYKYSKNMRKNQYITYYSYWNKNKIYDTKLEINVLKYRNKKVNANYVMQNFIRSLGHFNTTSKLPCGNILSDCNSGKKYFTKKDLEILKYHYSYGICKFTNLEVFEDAHYRAKEHFLKTGQYPNFMHKH